jgi:hypothetical protein
MKSPLQRVERQYLFSLAYINTPGSHRDALSKLLELGYIKKGDGWVITPEGATAIKRENILSMVITDNGATISEV